MIVLADDLGWGDVGYHGSEIRTPNIDGLAEEGVRLESFYTLQSCSPARAALMTGRYPMRYGFARGAVRDNGSMVLPTRERTLAEVLSAVGYRTVLTGKWHLGHGPGHTPIDRGFEEQYGGYLSGAGYFDRLRGHPSYRLDWYRNGKPLAETGYTTDLIAAEAENVIVGHDLARRLFLYVPFTAPHVPLEAPPAIVASYEHLADPERRVYAAMVESLDAGVGRILRALDQRGMRDDTLVVFLSDNGAATYQAGSNAPLRGGKKDLYEGGLRVPAIAAWPGTLESGREVDVPLHMVDWFPTLVRLSRAKLKPDLPLDGIDIWPTLVEGRDTGREELLLNYIRPSHGALRRGAWKFLALKCKDGKVWTELFNLEKDPEESTDLSTAHPEIAADLRDRLDIWGEQASKKPKAGSRASPCGREASDLSGANES
ncbi:arylsulfatase [Myxococcota bacterium]|nr:arylsulfatase [Myxococcota bacterium]